MALEKFDEITKIDEAIDGALTVLHNLKETDESYGKVVDQLTKLMKIKEMIGNLQLKHKEAQLRSAELVFKQMEADKPDRVSKEVWATLAANLVGIGMIIGYERVNVIASKALGFVMRAR